MGSRLMVSSGPSVGIDQIDGALDGGPLIHVVAEEHRDVAAEVERLVLQDGHVDDAVPRDVLDDLLQEVDLVVVEVGAVDELPDCSPGCVLVETDAFPDEADYGLVRELFSAFLLGAYFLIEDSLQLRDVLACKGLVLVDFPDAFCILMFVEISVEKIGRAHV